MVRSFAPLAASAALALLALPSAAAAAGLEPGTATPVIVQAAVPAPRTFSLTTSAHVDYAPDLALLSLGVRSQAATAAAAAASANAVGTRLLAALDRLGIERKDVQTSRYEVSFTDAVAPVYSLHGRERIVTQPGHAASYTVETTFAVRAPIAKAGDAIDAAIRAGANSSYDLSFASSHIDDYYAQALESAMRSARARAAALAAAAGVTIDALQSVTTSGAPSSDAAPAATMQAERFARAAPIAAGTLAVDASVDVVYTIR